MSAGGRLAGLDLLEGPDDSDAHEAEQREPAEDIYEGPECGLAAELLIERGLGRGCGVGRTEGVGECVLRGVEGVLELLAGDRYGVEDLVLVDVGAAGEQGAGDGDADGAADVTHEVEDAGRVADLVVAERAVSGG